MKKIWSKTILFAAAFCGMLWFAMPVEAKENDTIKNGVFVGFAEGEKVLELSGMTAVEAENVIAEYMNTLAETELTLIAGGDNEVSVTPGELGLAWANPEIVEEALELGTSGNVIQRYKAIKDLEHENKIFVLELKADNVAISTFLAENCTKYDREAVNMSLSRENGEFSVVEGKPGYALDVEVSAGIVYEFLTENWTREPESVALSVEVTEPKGSAEELAKVKDVLGSFTTSYASSNSNRQGNIRRGTELINGTTLYPGEEFSTATVMEPFNAKNGYYEAGSFINGKVVDSYGGGICQVSTTLYNAILLSELDVTMRYNHSMIVTYVEPSADAAITSSDGKDLRFVNNTENPIYIEGYTTSDKKVVFNIYGVETRESSHSVEYVSEILEVINPTTENIYVDETKPIGYIDVDSAHIGYKSRLWKITKENGVEVSREQVNKSNYKMTPRSAVVGVATADPNAYNEIMAAIGTNNIDHVKNVIAILTAPPAQ